MTVQSWFEKRHLYVQIILGLDVDRDSLQAFFCICSAIHLFYNANMIHILIYNYRKTSIPPDHFVSNRPIDPKATNLLPINWFVFIHWVTYIQLIYPHSPDITWNHLILLQSYDSTNYLRLDIFFKIFKFYCLRFKIIDVERLFFPSNPQNICLF